MTDWKPISEVPLNCPLWICVLDRAGVRSLGFPCRFTGEGWVNAVTNTIVPFNPTHWQHWPQRQLDREHEGRMRAIQLLLSAELATLYEIFLQQPAPPEITRLLDRLASRELEELSPGSHLGDARIGRASGPKTSLSS